MQVFVPYKYLYLFDESRSAHVSFEGNANASYNCDIMSHNAKLIDVYKRQEVETATSKQAKIISAVEETARLENACLLYTSRCV